MSTSMMTDRVTQAWPRLYARIAGALYLIVIVGGIFAEIFVRGRLVVHGDAAATAQNILAHELLYRLGFVVEVFYCVCNVPLILILYNLFKVVNKNVALMMVFFAFVVDAIESVSLLAHFAPLLLLGGGHYLSAFTAEQLQANLHIFSNPENKTGGDTYARGSTNTPAGRPSPIKLVRTPKIAMIPTLSTHNTQSVEIVEMTVLVIYPSLTPPDWLRSVASRAQLPT